MRATPEPDRMIHLRSTSASIGHDLRNAVMPLLLHLDMLDFHAAASDAASRTSVAALTANLQRLSNGLLLRSTTATNATTESIHLDAWWSQLGELVQAPLPATATLTVRLPHSLPPVRADASVLAQVVLHVMVTARLNLPHGQPARIRLAGRRSDTGVALRITSSDIERSRTHLRRETSQAQHWGLALAHSLLERSGGQLSGYSSTEQGTHVCLRLLAATPADRQGATCMVEPDTRNALESGVNHSGSHAAAPSATQVSCAALRVLIIDDNAALTGALALRFMMEPDIDTLPALHTLHDAVAHVMAHQPTIVLLDLNLPGQDNPLDVIRALRDRNAAVCVVVLTGNPSPEAIHASREAGAAGFIAKGVAPDRLIAALRRVRIGDFVLELDG